MAATSSSHNRLPSVVELFEEKWSRYDNWYEEHRAIYETELLTVREALRGIDAWRSVEVGVGTGRFAAPLGIGLGIDPSINMLRVARSRGVESVAGIAEALPLRSNSLEAALLIVTICFVDDPREAVREAARVARYVIPCIVPRESSWGRFYEARRDRSPFYRHARFYTVREIVDMGEEAGLRLEGCASSLYTPPPGPREPEKPRRVCDEEAGFVCIRLSRRATQ